MNVTCPNCATIYRVDPAKVPEGGVRARCNVCSAVFAVKREGEAEPSRPAAKEPAAATSAKPEAPVVRPQRTELPKAPPKAEPSRVAEPPKVSPPQPEPPRPVAAPGPAIRPAAPAGAAEIPGLPPRPASPQRPVSPAAHQQVTSAPTAPAGRPAVGPRAGPQPPATPPAPSRAPAPPAQAAAAPAAPKPAAPPRPPASPPGGGRPANPFLSQDPALKARRLARALISDMVVYHPGKRQEGLRDGNLKELFEEEIKKSWEEYAEQVGRELAESTTYFREALNEILAGGRQIF